MGSAGTPGMRNGAVASIAVLPEAKTAQQRWAVFVYSSEDSTLLWIDGGAIRIAGRGRRPPVWP